MDENKWAEADKAAKKSEPWRTSRKIRGFRIELNEIDSNLSQSPLIRVSKTLVRRNKCEEPILVSYIVPELNEWSQFLKANNFEDVNDEGTDIRPTKVYFKRFRRM